MKSELISSFNKTLFEQTTDIGIDFLEMALDEVTDNEFVKDIPVVGTIIKLGKAAITINDRRMIKKMLIFVREINNSNLSEEELQTHYEKLEKDPKEAQKELEYIIAILDKQIEYEKSKLHAKLYIAYLKRNIDWARFNCFSDILDRLVLYDLDTLRDIYDKYSYGENEAPDVAQMSRLSSLGLVQFFNGTVVMVGKNKNIRGRITSEGKVFCEILFGE